MEEESNSLFASVGALLSRSSSSRKAWSARWITLSNAYQVFAAIVSRTMVGRGFVTITRGGEASAGTAGLVGIGIVGSGIGALRIGLIDLSHS